MSKLSLLLIFIIGCSGKSFERYYKLRSLRVVAIHADTPEINSNNFLPTATITLTPWISFLQGDDTTLDITMEACLDPGVSYGAEPSCDDSALVLDSDAEIEYDMSDLGSDNDYTGAMTTTFSLGISAEEFALIQAAHSSKALYNGVNILVSFVFEDQESSKKVKAFKRISITSKDDDELNTNPTIGNIQADDDDLDELPNSDVELTVDDIENIESFDFKNSKDELISKKEKFTISWFSTGGSIQYTRVDDDQDSEWDPPKATPVVVLAVVRDDRGGVSVQSVTLDD